MKPIMSKRNTVNPVIARSCLYPFSEYIIDINVDNSTDRVLVSWEFPNLERVQLLFHAEGNAELFFVSPSIVLPEEGEEGLFYTLGEVEIFLSKIKNDYVA